MLANHENTRMAEKKKQKADYKEKRKLYMHSLHFFYFRKCLVNIPRYPDRMQTISRAREI